MESHRAEKRPPPGGSEVIERLVASHREFLGFLEARVRDRAVAEEILQAAFVKSLERGSSIRDSESAVAWFYRLLRNSLIDHYRRSATEARVLAAQAGTQEPAADPGMWRAVCACIHTLIPTLKPGYQEIVRMADLEERPLAEVAAVLGITVNNATVRLHRGRQSLRRQLERSCGTCATHGCLDCRCGGAPEARPHPTAGG
jgi:RNA polymerase sigma-70 factor (ECF subfamily)